MAWQLTTKGLKIPKKNRNSAIIEAVFHTRYEDGRREVSFNREDLVAFAANLNISLPKNLGDIIYTFRYRTELPDSIREIAPEGETWVIRSVGRGQYQFALVADRPLLPNLNLAVTKIPDSTPGIVAKYTFSDEQALLARVRSNRLLDVFLGIACYSLQNHLRTTVTGMGQVETDEIYVGVDKNGAHYVVPVQAKGGSDKLNRVQIEQDIAVCSEKLPSLICRPIGVQFMKDNLIALFEFEQQGEDITIASEKHYLLVPPDDVTGEDLSGYRQLLPHSGLEAS